MSIYEKKKIQVRRKGHLAPSENRYVEVEAFLVGGEEGVFATWTEGKIVHFAAGDDGHWWEIGGYHVNWITQIISVLGSAENVAIKVRER